MTLVHRTTKDCERIVTVEDGGPVVVRDCADVDEIITLNIDPPVIEAAAGDFVEDIDM